MTYVRYGGFEVKLIFSSLTVISENGSWSHIDPRRNMPCPKTTSQRAHLLNAWLTTNLCLNQAAHPCEPLEDSTLIYRLQGYNRSLVSTIIATSRHVRCVDKKLTVVRESGGVHFRKCSSIFPWSSSNKLPNNIMFSKKITTIFLHGNNMHGSLWTAFAIACWRALPLSTTIKTICARRGWTSTHYIHTPTFKGKRRSLEIRYFHPIGYSHEQQRP